MSNFCANIKFIFDFITPRAPNVILKTGQYIFINKITIHSQKIADNIIANG